MVILHCTSFQFRNALLLDSGEFCTVIVQGLVAVFPSYKRFWKSKKTAVHTFIEQIFIYVQLPISQSWKAEGDVGQYGNTYPCLLMQGTDKQVEVVWPFLGLKSSEEGECLALPSCPCRF